MTLARLAAANRVTGPWGAGVGVGVAPVVTGDPLPRAAVARQARARRGRLDTAEPLCGVGGAERYGQNAKRTAPAWRVAAGVGPNSGARRRPGGGGAAGAGQVDG